MELKLFFRLLLNLCYHYINRTFMELKQRKSAAALLNATILIEPLWN